MRTVLLASATLYAAACALPALELTKSNGTVRVMAGWECLALGWSGLLAGVWGWLANPFWLYAFVMGWRNPGSQGAAALADLALALTTLTLLGRELPADEGNVLKMKVTRLRVGFYCWAVSFGVLLLAR